MTTIWITWEDVYSRILEISLGHCGDQLYDISRELDHRKNIYIVAEIMRTEFELPYHAYKFLQESVYIAPPLENSISDYMIYWSDIYIFNYSKNIFY
jgi:hypothetical protein